LKRIIITAGVCAFIVSALKILSLFSFGYRELIYSAVSIVLFTVGGFVLKILCPKLKLKKFFHFRQIHKEDIKLLIPMTVFVISGGFLLNYLTIILFGSLGISIPSSSFESFTTDNIWLSVLTVAVIPAVFEEIFFRGAVLSVMSKYKTIVAVTVSALFFAIVHGSVYYFFSNLFAGIVFSVMLNVTDSVYVSMISHFLNNILSYLLFEYSTRMTTVGFNDIVIWLLGFICIFSLFGSFGAIIAKYKAKLAAERPLINEGGLNWEKRKGKS